MESFKDLPVLLFDDQAAWEKWLTKNYGQNDGVWLKIAKKNQGVSSVSYAEALDEALCYGWIDGLVNRYDEQFYIQKFTPRRARSVWSKINTEKVTALIKAGKMQASGYVAIDAAKADGRWEAAYASSATMEIPDDFMAALGAEPKAKAFFDTLDRANHYAIYYRLQTTKKPETRQRKITELVAMLARGEKLH